MTLNRRTILSSVAASIAAAVTGPFTPTATPAAAAPVPVAVDRLAARVASAENALWGNRFTHLESLLPGLLADIDTATRYAPGPVSGRVAVVAARGWNVAAYYLTKMHHNGPAAEAAREATRHAQAASDPVLAAEAARLTATVRRRDPDPAKAVEAGPLVLAAASDIRDHGDLTQPGDVSAYARMLASAAYTAALRADADTAWGLLDEATAAFTGTTGGTGTAGTHVFNTVDLTVFRSSIARVLGDHGAALGHIRRVHPAQIATPERLARYWQDTALAAHGAGRVDEAIDALAHTATAVPDEIRYRPWARHLIHELQRTRPHDRTVRELAAFTQTVEGNTQ